MRTHPFGTDDLGQDLLARMIYGGRISLAVGLAAMLVATVAGIINRMEQNGFVRCRLDPADKRSKIVSQTERAAAVAQDMHATIQATEQQMLRSLTPEQIAALESALRTIYADLG